MNYLALIRHGESEWNAKNLFTGWRNPPLTERGKEEAKQAGKLLKKEGITFDLAFTSALERAKTSYTLIMAELGQTLTPTETKALNERDYGDLAGMNKDDARKKWGDEQVHIWRRSYDTRPPKGESLADTAERVLAYYEQEIAPPLQAGKNILLSAHGNSLRALVMHLDKLTQDQVMALNIATGEPYLYGVAEGKISKISLRP